MYEFLSECRKIEENAHQTYKLLAGNNHYSKELREVFLDLSDDENGHARSIDLAMQADRNDLAVTTFISWEKMKEAIALSEKFLHQVRKCHVNEEESLKMAIEMEQVLVKIHIQNALHFDNDQLMLLFQSLEEEDQKHIDKLKDCLDWWRSNNS